MNWLMTWSIFRNCLLSWTETCIWRFYRYNGCWFIPSCKCLVSLPIASQLESYDARRIHSICFIEVFFFFAYFCYFFICSRSTYRDSSGKSFLWNGYFSRGSLYTNLQLYGKLWDILYLFKHEWGIFMFSGRDTLLEIFLISRYRLFVWWKSENFHFLCFSW